MGQAVKLVQPARLEQAGHQEKIGAGLDLVGELVGEAEVAQNLPGCRRARSSSSSWYLRMPLTQNDELNVALQEPVGHLGQQVPALLGVEPADLREQRDIGTLGEPGLPLEPGLASGLALADARRVITARPASARGSGSRPRCRSR